MNQGRYHPHGRNRHGTTPLARYIAARPQLTSAEKRILGTLYCWGRVDELAEIRDILNAFIKEVYP